MQVTMFILPLNYHYMVSGKGLGTGYLLCPGRNGITCHGMFNHSFYGCPVSLPWKIVSNVVVCVETKQSVTKATSRLWRWLSRGLQFRHWLTNVLVRDIYKSHSTGHIIIVCAFSYYSSNTLDLKWVWLTLIFQLNIWEKLTQMICPNHHINHKTVCPNALKVSFYSVLNRTLCFRLEYFVECHPLVLCTN